MDVVFPLGYFSHPSCLNGMFTGLRSRSLRATGDDQSGGGSALSSACAVQNGGDKSDITTLFVDNRIDSAGFFAYDPQHLHRKLHDARWSAAEGVEPAQADGGLQRRADDRPVDAYRLQRAESPLMAGIVIADFQREA